MELIQTPAHHTIESFVAVSPCTVYDILAHINLWPEWQAGVKILNDTPLADTNSTFKWNNGGMMISTRITQARKCEKIEWTSKAMWIKAQISWEMETEGEGCRIRYHQTITGFGAQLMKNALIKSMETTLLELRKYAQEEAFA